MDWQTQNTKVYNENAAELAAHFVGAGSRIADIERGLHLANKPTHAKVIEIGCGDGRDATEIVKRVAWYQGFDPSSGLLEIAKAKNPSAIFTLSDALSYEYPNNINVVYAFASLLHVDKDDMREVFKKVHKSLRKNGIFYISLKARDLYTAEIKNDQFGERMFFYYNPEIIKAIAGNKYLSIYEDYQVIGKTTWFTIALKKQ